MYSTVSLLIIIVVILSLIIGTKKNQQRSTSSSFSDIKTKSQENTKKEMLNEIESKRDPKSNHYDDSVSSPYVF